jgi:thiol:disulfide interchange protein DsbD
MKKLFAFSLCLAWFTWAGAQVKDPVQWVFSVKKLDAARYEVHLSASIAPGWHLYSQTTPDGGPVATSFQFVKNPLLTLQGPTKEVGKLEQHHEDLFGVEVKQYSQKVDFVQVIQLKGKAHTALSGRVDYMVCNDQECLPPTAKKFSIALK